jgi:hypothetical protein
MDSNDIPDILLDKDRKFHEWKRRLQRLCWNKYNCNLGDLPDLSYESWFDEGWTPVQALDEMLQVGVLNPVDDE